MKKIQMTFIWVLLPFLWGCSELLSDVPIQKDEERIAAHADLPFSAEETYREAISEENLGKEEYFISGEVTGELFCSEAEAETKVMGPEKKTGPEPAESEKKNNEERHLSLDEAFELCESARGLWQKGESGEALELLDRAYAVLLAADQSDTGSKKEKNRLRVTISKRVMEIHASRNVVAKGRCNAIPLVMNEHVRAEIEFLTRSQSRKEKFLFRAYKRSGRYRPYILEELRKAGLPEELSWLPLIESGYRVYAMSEARALGLWQFIQSTGAKFGLRRDSYVDERLDPYKSTKAAIAYLKELHDIFGDWTTVLAAYNCGEERVLRVIRKQRVNYLDNFWDLYKRLPKETARYVPRFLATLHIMNEPEKYGLDRVNPYPPHTYETMPVSRKLNLRKLARNLGIREKALKELNPELRLDMVPGQGYMLRIPSDKKSRIFLAKLEEKDTMAKAHEDNPDLKTYRVRHGDVPHAIAKRHNMPLKRFLRLNRLTPRSIIYPGQQLRVGSGK